METFVVVIPNVGNDPIFHKTSNWNRLNKDDAREMAGTGTGIVVVHLSLRSKDKRVDLRFLVSRMESNIHHKKPQDSEKIDRLLAEDSWTIGSSQWRVW